MKAFLIFIVTISISNNLFSQNQKLKWILVATNNIGGKTFISANIQSKTKGIIKLWSKDVNKQLDSTTKLPYQPVNLIEVDCNIHRMKLDSSILYDSKGKIIFANGYDEKWDKVTSGSIGDLIIKKACAVFNK